MNSIGKKYNIVFKKANGFVKDDLRTFKYIGTGETAYTGKITIDILSSSTLNFFRKNINSERITDINNEFAIELIGVLGHELIHRAQLLKYGFKVLNSTINVNKIESSIIQFIEYLKQRHEMMAYAQDAAYEVLNNKEPYIFHMYQNYFSY